MVWLAAKERSCIRMHRHTLVNVLPATMFVWKLLPILPNYTLLSH